MRSSSQPIKLWLRTSSREKPRLLRMSISNLNTQFRNCCGIMNSINLMSIHKIKSQLTTLPWVSSFISPSRSSKPIRSTSKNKKPISNITRFHWISSLRSSICWDRDILSLTTLWPMDRLMKKASEQLLTSSPRLMNSCRELEQRSQTIKSGLSCQLWIWMETTYSTLKKLLESWTKRRKSVEEFSALKKLERNEPKIYNTFWDKLW